MPDWHALTMQVSDATYAAWNAHDPDAVAKWFTADARVRDATQSEWEIGPEPVRARAAMLCTALGDLTLTRLGLLIDGPRHADRWRMAGTHTGELFGVAGTGRTMSFEGATFTTIDEEGMVIEDIHHADLTPLLSLLDASSRP